EDAHHAHLHRFKRSLSLSRRFTIESRVTQVLQRNAACFGQQPFQRIDAVVRGGQLNQQRQRDVQNLLRFLIVKAIGAGPPAAFDRGGGGFGRSAHLPALSAGLRPLMTYQRLMLLMASTLCSVMSAAANPAAIISATRSPSPYSFQNISPLKAVSQFF